MSKRALKNNEKSQRPPKESRNNWSLGLVDSMKDPEAVYKETERLVVIRDKYPKARVHYLVLPREEISSIYQLNSTHVDLIAEFGSMYQNIKSEHEEDELKAGFHAVPSMQRLHMHVISKDMDSKCLKTKIHWNSFTTSFFIAYENLLKRLKEDGCIERIPSETHKALMSTPLKCNQCGFEPKNMPQLKQHLLTHLK
ncbi:aprataxin [Maniola hyperantus]|uniref:aprataxin n=1 Tax=Aphantopus hyperantus TaxID=2795564 RepID=UPI0015691D01|nr:aprataxin [Maniola hyperantus]